MNLFQLIVFPLLALLAVLEIRAFVSSRGLVHLLRLLVWTSAAILIVFPALSSRLASLLGIGRGTDLVLYGFVLFATAFLFHLYGRQHRLRQDLVILARQQAIDSASKSPPGGQPDSELNS